ncbi:MAG: hypothetical protein JF616_18680 [Fibrobacteres bacterium]|nr:hypothetical protein [Fibrobacterota bacterium]
MKIRAVLAALALAACVLSPDRQARGGGSDTETLSGLVTGATGAPAAAVQVKLIPAGYDPSRPDTTLIRRTLTGSDGSFRFEKVDTSIAWNLIAGESALKSWAFAGALRAGGSRHALALSEPKVFLVSLHSAAYAAKDSGIAYFPGTDILARCDAISVSRLDSVPAGASRIVIESRAGWKHDTTLVAVADTARVVADSAGIRITP